MENQGHVSIPVDSSIQVIEPKAISPLISEVTIKVCYIGENRNGSLISKDVAEKMSTTLRGCPIVGYYNDTKEDFEGHNQIIDISNGEWKFKDTTQAYGFVDLNAKPWFQDFVDDGVTHTYLMVKGYLWTGQYPEETKGVVTKGNPQSMELDENHLDGYWSDPDNNGMSFYIINDAVISKLCILGTDVEPCFEGASVSKMQFSLGEDFQNKILDMMSQVERINKKGGTSSVEKKKVEEQAQFEQKTEDIPAPAPVKTEETKPVEYNLDEIQEYVDLKKKYETLQTEFSSMKDEYDKLVEFKNKVDRKEKEDKIKEFYMLSDEDKKDVVENIDKYSVEDIEEKLAVICFRKKISFDLEDETKKEEKEENKPTVFSLDSTLNTADETTPEWVKAVKMTQEEME